MGMKRALSTSRRKLCQVVAQLPGTDRSTELSAVGSVEAVLFNIGELDFVEQLYIALTCGAWDKSALAASKRNNPYPALFGTIDGIPWSSEVICGHNPWLHARRVKNLSITINDDNTQEASWEEVARSDVTRLRTHDA